MAEAEITLRYRELPIEIAYRAFLVCIPLLVIFIIWSSLAILITPGVAFAGFSMVFGAEMLLLALISVMSLLCGDETVFVTRDGISLPFVLCPSFGTRTHREWSDLVSVRFDPRAFGGILTLVFRTGSPVRFKLKNMSAEVVDDLIVAVDVWGGGSESFPALLEARTMLSGEKQIEARSHTEIWEDELTRRFGATNFIPLEPGQSVREGELTVVRQMAFGGMSAIYEVKDSKERKLVLKESVVPDESDENLRVKACELLAREAQILSRLSHPRIASIMDHFVEGNRDYLVLQHLNGQDLRRLVKEFGKQPEASVLEWAIQIAELLVFLHQQEIPVVHKDLTPDNLVLEEDGMVSLIDFGAANLFIGTATGTIIGKQAYISPEQLRGKATLQSDIYSFGGTIFFLLTGDDPEPLAVSRPAEKRSEISSELSDIVAACTELELEDRLSSSQELLERLCSLKK